MAGDGWQWQTALSYYDKSIRTLESVLRVHGPIGPTEQFLVNARDGKADLLARMTPRATASRSGGWFARWFKRKTAPPAPPQIEGAATIAPRPSGPKPHFPDPEFEFPADATDGLESLQAGRYTETLAALDRFLAARPGDAAALYWKAWTLGQLEHYPEALEAMDEALKLDPDCIPALTDKSDILRFLNHAEEALEAVDRVLRLDPERALAWHLKGLILGQFLDDKGGPLCPFDATRNDQAIDAFDEAVLLEPDYFAARLFKGRALVGSAHAAQALSRIIAHVVNEDWGPELAQDYLRPFALSYQCCFVRARESFDAAIRVRPENYRPWYEKGRLLADLEDGHEEAAIEAFSRAVELRPDLAEGWYGLAELHAQQNEREEARRCLRQAILADPNMKDRARADFDWISEDDL